MFGDPLGYVVRDLQKLSQHKSDHNMKNLI